MRYLRVSWKNDLLMNKKNLSFVENSMQLNTFTVHNQKIVKLFEIVLKKKNLQF